MDIQTRRSVKVELASIADFRVGPALVSPSTRQLICGSERVTLEPRVMQLLVVLGQARGEVISRDELVMRCWDGVVVGENAINRVVSLLRTTAADTCGGAFEIETIKKVGYRLTVRGAHDRNPLPPPAAASGGSRRALLGAGATVLALGGMGLYFWQRRDEPPSEARALYERGLIAQRQGLSDQTDQAISFLTEAVKIAPDYADAWGALALSYRHKLVDDQSADPQRYARLIDSAAARALALDPDNADAPVARLLMQSYYRRWLESERAFQDALVRSPDHWLLRGSLGRLMYDVGRWTAGVPLFEANVARDPFLPISRISLAEGLWALGRLQEADQVYREALDRWPKHPRIWLSAYNFFALSNQVGRALALAADENSWGAGLPPALIEQNVMWTTALDSGEKGEIERAAASLRRLADEAPGAIPHAMQISAALGQTDTVFELTDRYFGTPADRPRQTGAAARREDWRYTAFLFTPPLARLRGDDRFAALTARIGLDDYWRRSGSQPDAAAIA